MFHVKRSPGALERPAGVELIPSVRPFWECDTGLALQLQVKTGLKAARFEFGHLVLGPRLQIGERVRIGRT